MGPCISKAQIVGRQKCGASRELSLYATIPSYFQSRFDKGHASIPQYSRNNVCRRDPGYVLGIADLNFARMHSWVVEFTTPTHQLIFVDNSFYTQKQNVKYNI